MQTATWMWADASLIGHSAAKLNPLRWSDKKSIEDTISDLQILKIEESAKAGRPVTIRLQDNLRVLDDEDPHRNESELEQVYPDVERAISGLQKHLTASTARRTTLTEEHYQMEREVVNVPLHALRAHLTRESTVSARWMWDDVGLTESFPQYRSLSQCNPFRWSDWGSLEETIHNLKSLSNMGLAERPVNVQIKIKSPEEAVMRYEEAAPRADVITTLEQLLLFRITL